MNKLGLTDIGQIIRKVRKEKGLRLEDVADENISPATISNIERGVSHVRQDKAYYLLEKLNIAVEDIPTILLGEKRQLNDLKFELDLVESMKRTGLLKEAMETLNQLDVLDEHPYAPIYHWLKGTILLFQNKYQKAERSFTEAIRLSKNNRYATIENIEAYSFNDLGLCCYYESDLDRALQFSKSGLDAFNSDGKKVVKYILIQNQATYLERLGRTVEALQIVEEIWDELLQINKTDTALGLYWLKSELLRQTGAQEEAARVALDGLKLAGLNHQHSSSFDMWVVLGSIYMDQKELKKADRCFNIALQIANQHVYGNRVIRGYIKLGELKTLMEDWEQATKVLNQAVDMGEKLNCTPYSLDANLTLGDLHLAQNKVLEAIDFYEKVVSTANKHREKERKAWFQLARCWKGRNEKEFKRATENMFNIELELKGR